MNEKIAVRRLGRVKADEAKCGDSNILAFENVEFTISGLFNDQFVLDTKIMKDGRQLVIDGNGWVDYGYDITNLK